MSDAALFRMSGLTVGFDGVPVLHGVDLAVHKGEALGLVGESGSGKSVTWLAALGLLPAKASVRGCARLDGTELIGATAATLDEVRGGRVAMIFQDPASALNPAIEALHGSFVLDKACAAPAGLAGKLSLGVGGINACVISRPWPT